MDQCLKVGHRNDRKDVYDNKYALMQGPDYVLGMHKLA
jgi:hypothetical protein